MASVDNRSEAIQKNYDTSTYTVEGGETDVVRQEFAQVDPASINNACTAWSRLADHLGGLANTLRGEAGAPLHDAWEGQGSPEAQQQLQVAQATASALAGQAMQMARATDWAYQYASWYKAHVPGDGLVNGPTNHDEKAMQNKRPSL